MNTKQYFVVRGLTAANGSVTVASGVIPATSPALTESGAPTEGSYTLHKVIEGGSTPTGASVVELTVDEARMATESELFNGTAPTVSFIELEQLCAQHVRAEFMAAQAGLPIADADALLTVLEPTSHALSAGSLNIAYSRFNASAADPAMKSAFLPLFEDFFTKFPRDQT